MHFLRDVGQDQLLRALKQSVEENSPGELQRIGPDLASLHAIVKDVKKGDELRLVYAPGEGVELTGADGASARVPGHAVAAALLRAWLGERPSDQGLKRRLLGLR